MVRLKTEAIEKIRKGEITVAEVVKISPKQVAALLVTGHKLFQQGRLTDATNIFEGIVLLAGGTAYAHGILGTICQKQNKHEDSVKHFTEALRLFPQDIDSLTNRGEVYIRLGRFKEAAEDLAQAIELDPFMEHPAANRARLLVCLVKDAVQLAKEKGIQALDQERLKVRRVS
jgi:tetratricopeptide (TPR) repeat protein